MSAAQTVKRLWKKAHSIDPLKTWAKENLETIEEVKVWFQNKAGLPQKKQKAERKKNKGNLLQLIASATKNSRRKTSK